MLNHGAKVQKFSDIRKKKSENWGKIIPPVGNLSPVAILGGCAQKKGQFLAHVIFLLYLCSRKGFSVLSQSMEELLLAQLK